MGQSFVRLRGPLLPSESLRREQLVRQFVLKWTARREQRPSRACLPNAGMDYCQKFVYLAGSLPQGKLPESMHFHVVEVAARNSWAAICGR